jgi:hypothetical protein
VRVPNNLDSWPALRLVNGGVFKGMGGLISGSLGKSGGHAVEIYNGKSTPETASFGYYFEGLTVIGEDASIGEGGNSLYSMLCYFRFAPTSDVCLYSDLVKFMVLEPKPSSKAES